MRFRRLRAEPPTPAGLLRDASGRRSLDSDGYVVIDLLDQDQVGDLLVARAALGSTPGDPRSGLFNDTFSSEPMYKRQVEAAVAPIMTSALGMHLDGFRMVGCVFIAKWPGEAGRVVPHQDASFVDEGRFHSFMCWCPLVDTQVTGGTLEVIPGSHRYRRGTRAHQDPTNAFADLDADDVPWRALSMRVGQAVLYDHALIHRSGANTGSDVRLALGAPLIPSAATLMYALLAEEDAEVFAIDEAFFLDHQLDRLDLAAVRREYRSLGRRRVAGHLDRRAVVARG